MLTKVEFLQDYRNLKKGEFIEFRKGVNLIVGEQGTGKSSLIQCIRDHSKTKNKIIKISGGRIGMFSFDFEKDNPRSKRHFDDNIDIMAQVQMAWLSHGEVNNALVSNLPNAKDTLFVFDEPDSALSIRSVLKMIKNFNKAVENGCQIVAVVHNPILISAFDEVYSMEHRRWMKSKDFIKEHMDDAEKTISGS